MANVVLNRDDWRAWLRANSNWGRWGADDQKGALNLIDDAKRAAAAAEVRQGRCVSLARDLMTRPGPANPQPVQHFVRWFHHAPRPDTARPGGGAGEYLGLHVHGYQGTHIDALCHAWGERGMWNGRDPNAELAPQGARWGGLEHWKSGVITRAVLLDVAGHRGVEHVEFDRPVHGDELEAVARAQGVTIGAGDAVIVHAGRDALERARPDWNPNTDPHPGLSLTALKFLRAHDVAVLAWDLMDAQPFELGWPLVPHAALWELGIALIDNCSLDTAVAACRAAGRSAGMLVVAPLPLVGGTGSPVNPLFIL
ncbi:MAG: cyclase family protein [Rhodospirillaceae bacterium]|nr:cyclase family protein [Rhodospirillaceae bacterium]